MNSEILPIATRIEEVLQEFKTNFKSLKEPDPYKQ